MSVEDKILVEIDEKLKRIFHKFFEKQKNDFAAMKRAHKTLNFEELKWFGHLMRGTCGGYGLPELGRMAADIEVAAQNKDENRVTETLKQMDHYFSNLEVQFVKK